MSGPLHQALSQLLTGLCVSPERFPLVHGEGSRARRVGSQQTRWAAPSLTPKLFSLDGTGLLPTASCFWEEYWLTLCSGKR